MLNVCPCVCELAVTLLILLLHRKTLLLATGIVVAGGAAAYVQSRLTYKKHDSFGQYNGLNENKETEKAVTNDHKIKKPPQKRGGLKSLQVLAAILLSEMGQMGARDLLSLVGIVVSRKPLNFLYWSELLCLYF